MTSTNGKNQHFQGIEESYDPNELIAFLKENLKLILISTLVGLILAIIYLIVTPSQYEATAQVEMAQIADFSRFDGPTVSLSEARYLIEDPNALVGRLFLPSSFDEETINACEMPDHPLKNEILARSVKATVMKKVLNVAELSIRHESAALAIKCATAIFIMIQRQQSDMVNQRLERAKSTVESLKAMIASLESELARNTAAQNQQVTYLAKREELLLLKNQVIALELKIKNSTQTHLLAPIFASKKPVFPKRLLTLALGLFSGIIIGTSVAVARRVFK